jgi:hypothetical protein
MRLTRERASKLIVLSETFPKKVEKDGGTYRGEEEWGSGSEE